MHILPLAQLAGAAAEALGDLFSGNAENNFADMSGEALTGNASNKNDRLHEQALTVLENSMSAGASTSPERGQASGENFVAGGFG